MLALRPPALFLSSRLCAWGACASPGMTGRGLSKIQIPLNSIASRFGERKKKCARRNTCGLNQPPFVVPQVVMGAAAATRLESLTVAPISLISGEVELPGSKSLSNRVLLLSALAEVRWLSETRQ